MGIKLGELFVELGIHSDIQKLNKFVSGLRRGVLEAAVFVAGLYHLSSSMKEIFTDTLNTEESFRLFRNTTGLATKELEKWIIAGKKVGIESRVIQSSIENLVSIMNKIRYARMGIPEGFKLMGLDTSATPYQNFIKAYKKVQETLNDKNIVNPYARATSLLGDIGFPPELMNLFAKPPGELLNLLPSANQRFFDNEQQRIIEEFTKNMGELNAALTPILRELVTYFVKPLNKAIDTSQEFMPKMFKGVTIADILNQAFKYVKWGTMPIGIDKLRSMTSSAEKLVYNITMTINTTGDQTGDPVVVERNIQEAMTGIKAAN